MFDEKFSKDEFFYEEKREHLPLKEVLLTGKRGKNSLHNVKVITCIGILAALSLLLLWIIPGGGFSIIPVTPWLKYDLVDIPVLLGAFLLGPIPSLFLLGLVAGFQSLFFGSDGWVGFFMHFLASGLFVALASYIYRWKPHFKGQIFGLVVGGAVMIFCMLVLNLYFIPLVYPITFEQAKILLPWNLLFNVIKVSLNGFLSLLVWKTLAPSLRKYL